jgi:hypothetical protein
MSNLSSSKGTRTAPAPSTLHAPYPGAQESEWVPQDRMGLTPEQAGVMDLLEGRVIRAPLTTAKRASSGGLQRDVVLALLGGACLMAGMVAVFFMAAVGAVLLVVGALFCVAAYEHAISADALAIKEQAAQQRAERAQNSQKSGTTSSLL